MSKLQVLVTTMHQSDLSKYRLMNLQTDAVIANQADHNGFVEEQINGSNVQMVTTATRGASRNRNIALAHANQKAEYIMFSDDDLVFTDGYEQLIISEFKAHPEVEAIKFNIHDLSTTRKISMKQIVKFERANRRNMSSSGVWGLAVRTDVLKNSNLHFREDFGPGTENYCGEDTIFLMEMLKKKIKIYRSPVDIAGIDQSESSWFQGRNEKYFVTIGKVFRIIMPHMAYPLAVRGAFRFSKRENCTMKFGQILKCYVKGIRGK